MIRLKIWRTKFGKSELLNIVSPENYNLYCQDCKNIISLSMDYAQLKNILKTKTVFCPFCGKKIDISLDDIYDDEEIYEINESVSKTPIPEDPHVFLFNDDENCAVYLDDDEIKRRDELSTINEVL